MYRITNANIPMFRITNPKQRKNPTQRKKKESPSKPQYNSADVGRRFK